MPERLTVLILFIGFKRTWHTSSTANGLRLRPKVGLNLPVYEKIEKDEKESKSTIQGQKLTFTSFIWTRKKRAPVLWALGRAGASRSITDHS
jgi:hypothetical protein